MVEKINKIKETIIKSLLVSQLVYILTPLQTCSEAMKETNELLYKFLWDGKGDRIRRSIMICDYEDGGAKMVDIVSFNHALKATWVAKYFDETNKGKWKADFDYDLSDLGKKYFCI